MTILALNVGSSTLKHKLMAVAGAGETILASGAEEYQDGESLERAVERAIRGCSARPTAVGHRVVHGGADVREMAWLTPDTIAALRSLRELNPLHSDAEMSVIEAARRILPDVPDAAVFDTAFHHTLPDVAARYALPADVVERFRLRRYGFHGLSHAYVSQALLERMGREAAGTRLVICHLGSGASVCAVRDGRSVDTSMGMTPLEGLVMATRCGDVDPGLLLYLLRVGRIPPVELDEMLNTRSGLLGISGRSGDVRELEASERKGDAEAALALDLFAYRVRKYIGAYAAALGGLDALAFSGGIGERSPSMRQRICQGLEFLGVRLDDARNRAASGEEPAPLGADGEAPVWLIPTDEERQIARAVRAAWTPRI